MSSSALIKKSFVYLLAGILFGIGLALSGMTDPAIVTGFLDVFGDWNISLIFVMVGAIAVTSTAYHFLFKIEKPVFDSQFYIPEKTEIDKHLIIGAMLFGIGWGIYGFCPGPALASLVSLNTQTFVFVICMVLGMIGMDRLSKHL